MLAMSPFAKVDLGRAAGTLDEDEFGVALQALEALEHRWQERGFRPWYA